MADKGGLTRKQVEAFAIGLYYVAATDGVEDRELQVIRDFLKDAGAVDFAARLADAPFDPVHLMQALDTEWLRRTFLRSAVLLVKADGRISETERHAIAWLSRGLGVNATIEELESSVAGQKL